MMKQTDSAEAIRQLVARDRLDRALQAAEGLAPGGDREWLDELVVLRGKLQRLERDDRRGLLSEAEAGRTRAQIQYALLSLLEALNRPAVTTGGSPSVFLSYNHGDREVAGKLRQALEAREIAVRIDAQHMDAGESIEAFIRRSIRDTDLTLGLVSERSLLSDWVAVETLSTFWEEKSREQRRFIACYLDDGFFASDFRLKANRRIDARVAEIDGLMAEYLKEGLDTVDLNEQRSRLLRLRQGLGDILARLKDSLALDVREPEFEASVERIVATLLRSEGAA